MTKEQLMSIRKHFTTNALRFARMLFLILGIQVMIFATESTAQEKLQQTSADTLRVIAHIATSWVVGNAVVEPLVYVDNANNFIPKLAKDWNITENYMDLHLQENVLFQDGTPFDANSVINNWKHYVASAQKKAPYYTLDLRLAVRRMEVLGAHTVRMHFNKDAFKGQILVYLRSFYMYSPAYFKKFTDYPKGNQANILQAGPWGTGAYELVEVQKNGAVYSLQAFGQYWEEGYPRTKNLEIYGPTAIDTQTAYEWMIDGKADLFDAVSPSMLPLLNRHAEVKRSIHYPNSHLTTLFNMRKTDSALRDVRVRKAINLLIDRRVLQRFVSNGLGRMTAFILPLDSSDGLSPYPHDPKTALELLSEAGFDAQTPLSLVIGYYISEEKLALAITAMLRANGIKIELDKYITRQEYYQHIKNYTHGPDNPIEKERWDLSIVQSGLYTNTVATHFEAFYGKGGNRWIEADGEADRLFLNAMRAKNIEQANYGFKKMEHYLYDNYYSMPLLIWPSIFALNKRITNDTFSNSGYLLNLREISLEY